MRSVSVTGQTSKSKPDARIASPNMAKNRIAAAGSTWNVF